MYKVNCKVETRRKFHPEWSLYHGLPWTQEKSYCDSQHISLITVAIITSSIIKVFESCRLKRNSRSFRKRWLHSSELIENIFLLGTLIRYKSGKDHLKTPSSHIKNDFSITKKRHRASWKLLQKLLQEHLKVGYSFLK